VSIEAAVQVVQKVPTVQTVLNPIYDPGERAAKTRRWTFAI